MELVWLPSTPGPRQNPQYRIAFANKSRFKGSSGKEIDIKGWELRIPLKLQLVTTMQIPEDLVGKVLPEGYTVYKLVSTLMPDDKLVFEPQTTFLEKCSGEDVDLFYKAIWNWIKKLEGQGNSPALAFTISTTDVQGTKIPVTAVKVETLGRRRGDESQRQWSPDDPAHALCFLQLVWNRPMIAERLGTYTYNDFFYGPLSGCSCLGWHVFFQNYIAKKLEIINLKTKLGANEFARSFAPDKLPDWVITENRAHVYDNSWSINGREF